MHRESNRRNHRDAMVALHQLASANSGARYSDFTRTGASVECGTCGVRRRGVWRLAVACSAEAGPALRISSTCIVSGIALPTILQRHCWYEAGESSSSCLVRQQQLDCRVLPESHESGHQVPDSVCVMRTVHQVAGMVGKRPWPCVLLTSCMTLLRPGQACDKFCMVESAWWQQGNTGGDDT